MCSLSHICVFYRIEKDGVRADSDISSAGGSGTGGNGIGGSCASGSATGRVAASEFTESTFSATNVYAYTIIINIRFGYLECVVPSFDLFGYFDV